MPGVLVLLFSIYFLGASDYVPFSKPTWPNVEEDPEEYVGQDKETFVREAAGWEIDGEYDDAPLHDLCSGKEWTPGLIFKCDDGFGGVGNIRNIILTCVRYAIEAGATSLIIPQIEARDADLIELHAGRTLPFTYMFDEDFFIKCLTTACPQISIITSESLLNASISRAGLTPKDLGHKFKHGVDRVIDFASEFRSLFDAWIHDFGAPSGFSASNPLLVSITPSFFEFPILYDSASFIATFGRILRFNPSILHLAATVLYALDKEYKLNLEPAKVGIPAEGKFFGAHLRTDVDAVAAFFASYEEQSSAYLAAAKKHNLSFIYLASGSPPDIKRFTKTGKKMGIKVTTKLALLEGEEEFEEELKEMKALTWDQQALIDYMVLLRSSHFGGTWASSFSYNIVFRRHVVVGDGIWIPSRMALETRDLEVEERGSDLELADRWESIEEEKLGKGECYKDKINTVFGPPRMGIWFELSMWP